MLKIYLKGVGLLIGMIFGAGVFALPYVFSRAGIFWGLAHFFIALFILIFLHFWYAEIAYYTKGKHRFTGYVEFLLGAKSKILAFLSTLFSYYGSLLIYGILGGIFLANVFSFLPVEEMAILFFILGAIFTFGSLDKAAAINFYLTIPLLGFVIYLLFISFSSIKLNNLFIGSGFLNSNWFLPYGVWIFALGCTSIIPEVREIFLNVPIKKFKRIILISIILSAVFYLLFVVSVLGVSGLNTTANALSGITGVLGKVGLIIGSIIGFLAVFTSYIAIAIDMKYVFNYDYKIKSWIAWVLSVVPPIALYFLGIHDFVKTISIIGSVGLGIFGIFVILMRYSIHKKLLAGGYEKLIAPTSGEFMKRKYFLETVILLGILAGVLYEIFRIIF